MDRCKQQSKRWITINSDVVHDETDNRRVNSYRLRRAKGKALAKLNAQIKDAEHKITSRFVSDCNLALADTIVIGDIKGIRDRAKFSKKSNQKIHQWPFARLLEMIRYKAMLVGIKTQFEFERYTSQTCPECGHRYKPSNRNYHCKPCGFEYHRDGVGAINIWSKVSGWLFHPVVGAMASPRGVRFHPHLCKLA